MKKFVVVMMSVIAMFAITGCGGNDAPEQPPMQDGVSPHGDIPPVGKPVVEVPEAVKGKWKSVELLIENKDDGSVQDQTIQIGSRLTIPGSDLTIEVKEFFPAFVMQGSSITSASNEPINPAALVSVTEGGSEIFNGWLFAKYPTTHALSHPKYAITLKEGIAN